jgi:ankyrin repeat protein
MLEMKNDRYHPMKWSWDPDEDLEPRFNPLQAYQDALSLAATCEDLYTSLTAEIYLRDVRHNRSAALLRSAINGNVDGVVRSLDAGADIHMGDTTQSLIFCDSKWIFPATGGAKEIPTRLWFPCDLSDQVTALHWAAYYGHIDVVTLLLDRGADIDHRVRIDTRLNLDIRCYIDPDQVAYSYPTNICCDVVRHNVSEGHKLLHGVDKAVAVRILEHGANPLYFAIEGGDLRTAMLLIERGASLDTHVGTRVHALHQAVWYCDLSLVDFLLSIPGVTSTINTIRDGCRAGALHCLDYASEENVHTNCKIIKILMSHGYLLNIPDISNKLPVDEAVNARCYTAVSELIRHGSWMPHFLPATEEIMLAIDDVRARGLNICLRSWGLVNGVRDEGVHLMYLHFYKLVYRTNSIPPPMKNYLNSRWAIYWRGRL